MLRAAGQVEASHQRIHELQRRLQSDLPRLAEVLGGGHFAAFQRDYSAFDSQFERVKQELDTVHASLTGQRSGKVVGDPVPDDLPVGPEISSGLPDGASELAGANAELNSLLNALSSELEETMPGWDVDARRAWQEARRSWTEANRRQSEILTRLLE